MGVKSLARDARNQTCINGPLPLDEEKSFRYNPTMGSMMGNTQNIIKLKKCKKNSIFISFVFFYFTSYYMIQFSSLYVSKIK